jgi:hypothetical protein
MRVKADRLMGVKLDDYASGGNKEKLKCGGKVKKFAAGGAAKVRLREATPEGKPMKQPKCVKSNGHR